MHFTASLLYFHLFWGLFNSVNLIITQQKVIKDYQEFISNTSTIIYYRLIN